MGYLRSDSPICIRIVLAFLEFLTSVNAAPGVDLEGLEVARECLEVVFKLHKTTIDNKPPKGFLVKLFTSQTECQQNEANSEPAVSNKTATTSSGGDASSSGVSREELYQRFCKAVVDNNLFIAASMNQIFHDAIRELVSSGFQIYNIENLADGVKLLGNRAMRSKLFEEAAELYSCAIALVGNNAVYFCNRAAALNELQRYSEAIMDCHRSIEINPNYSKAYSRLGMAYYGQSNFIDAICKGFVKALQLSPNNDIVMNNILEAGKKIQEEVEWLYQQIGELEDRNDQEREANMAIFAFEPFDDPESPPSEDGEEGLDVYGSETIGGERLSLLDLLHLLTVRIPFTDYENIP